MEPRLLAVKMYDSFERRDGAALAAALAPSFTATLSDGLPVGGGSIASPEAMLAVWARAASKYDMHPRPDEIVPLPDGRVLAIGRYAGSARSTGKMVDALFAHVWTFEASARSRSCK
jgi:ketosteroid isomerase-like protein